MAWQPILPQPRLQAPHYRTSASLPEDGTAALSPLTDPGKQAFGAGVEVFVRRGQLMMRVLSPIPMLYGGFPLHPDDDNDPYVFQVDLARFGDDTNRFLSAFYEVVGDAGPATAMQSFMVRQSLLRVWGEFQQTYPLIVAPTYTDIPFEVGTDLDRGGVAETIRGMRMAIAVNALGLPAVTLPVGIAGGLPQSVRVIGPQYREDLWLEAAEAIENRLGIITPIDPR